MKILFVRKQRPLRNKSTDTRSQSVAMMTNLTTPTACAKTAIILKVGQRKPLNANIQNVLYTLKVSARTAISVSTTKRKDPQSRITRATSKKAMKTTYLQMSPAQLRSQKLQLEKPLLLLLAVNND